ncbi:class I SAM-dependent methyltransferase [Ammoniphilus sp. 3BR4]|uniref:class I SAM-dependent methyltransferase n=1 Tax=Ammoniphilus sp. 3BR4 TaxID=3158265 RepID=UPI003465B3AA
MDNQQIKAKVQDQFGKNAEKYVASESHAKANDLSEMIDWLSPESNHVALDIATGGGHVTKALSPQVGQVFSTDLTLPMLEAAKRHLDSTCKNVFYVQADSESLPFLEETFDIVVCRIAAHHFPNPERFVREVGRVLKPGGRFLLIDNVAPEQDGLDVYMNQLEKLRDESHVRCYTTLEWKQWFVQANLQYERAVLRKKTHNFPVWVRRTTETEEQVRRVEEHILAGSQDMQSYFSVTVEEGEIKSLQIDEWMVMLQKVQKGKE